jgi:conserved hypothetical protein
MKARPLRKRKHPDHVSLLRATIGALLLVTALFGFAPAPAAAETGPAGANNRVKGDASRVEKATIFLSGAELTRSMPVALRPGRNIVTFEGLPADVRPESVMAAISGDAQLISAAYRVNHLERPVVAERLARLREELKNVEDEVARTSGRIAVLEAEEEFFKLNRGIAGKDGIRLDDLRGVSEYFGARLTEIAEATFRERKALAELRERQARLTQELGESANDDMRAVGEIVVELSAARTEQAALSVSYFTPGAGWEPFYEIRVAEVNGPAKLVGKGRIRQTTGENWEDVAVVLSSGTPALGRQQPILMPWRLDFQYDGGGKLLSRSYNMMAAPMAETAMDAAMHDEIAPPAPKAKQAVVQQAQTSVEFVLPAPISLPSQEEARTVEILDADLAATYQHYSVRKLDRDAFLLAKVKGWEKLNLLAGEVGIFLENTYVGTTFLDPRQADDEMEISLGRDRGVIVTRVKGRDFAARSLLGKTQKDTREWLVTVRNTRPTPIDIRVLDQIPVSANKSITVETVEISGAELDADTGELRWELRLQPGESVQKTVKYTVSYPGGKSVFLE